MTTTIELYRAYRASLADDELRELFDQAEAGQAAEHVLRSRLSDDEYQRYRAVMLLLALGDEPGQGMSPAALQVIQEARQRVEALTG